MHERPPGTPPDAPTHETPRVQRPIEPEHAVATSAPADAGAHPPAGALPAFADAAGDLAPMVPRGSLVTVLLRSDHLRGNPDAMAVRRLLASIPDWNQMLGGSDLDPVRDLDTLVLAASQPFGTHEQPPDWFVLARGLGGSDAQLRRAIEQMAIPSSRPPPRRPMRRGGSTAGSVVRWRAARRKRVTADSPRSRGRRDLAAIRP